MPDTPTAQIVASAAAERQITDRLGRAIRYRRLGALDRARMFKAIGPLHSQNPPYLGMAMLAASVTQVDEVPWIFPQNDAHVEHAISQLGDDGLEAVAEAVANEMVQEAVARAASGGKNDSDGPQPT